MDMGRIFLVLAAAVVIGLTASSLTSARHGGGGHHGGDFGAHQIHSDGANGVYHMRDDQVRHCRRTDDVGGLGCGAWH